MATMLAVSHAQAALLSGSTVRISQKDAATASHQFASFQGLRQLTLSPSESCASSKLRSPSRQPLIVQSAAGSDSDVDNSAELNRRNLLAAGTGIALSLAAGSLVSLPPPALAANVPGAVPWEKISLPIDPGVVLLDIAFVPDEPSRGFLLGTRQTLLESRDGGRSWNQRTIPSAEEEDFNYRFNSISFSGSEGWIVGKPAILLHTTNAGESWERIPLSARLPGNPVLVKATGANSAEMVTDEGAIYVTSNKGYNWTAAVQETVAATLNRTVSSGISGASYYTGTFNTISRSDDGSYVAVSDRGNFFLTWQPGDSYWQPHNRNSARRLQSMGFRGDGGLWLLVRGGGLYFGQGSGVSENFEEAKISSRGFGLLDVGFKNEKEAYAAGGSGILLKSTDGGVSWIRERLEDKVAANLYSIKFMNEKQGFILGNDGVLLRYRG